MYDLLLRKARDLKRRSRTLRDSSDFPAAEKLLEQAIALLRDDVDSAAGTLPAGVPAASDVRDLATELADCWGSLGGVRRRHAELLRGEKRLDDAAARYGGAIDAYDQGLALEQDDRFRIANSYNLVQRVVVPVLASPDSLGEMALQNKLSEIEASIERQIATTRVDDAWAYSDLGLVQLLADKEPVANRTWDRMDNLKPQRNVYTSGLPVLESLAKALPQHRPLHRAAERFRGMCS